MNDKLRQFRELQEKLRAEKTRGDEARLSDIAEWEVALRQVYDSMSEEEQGAISFERRSSLVKEPMTMLAAGGTIVVEAFVLERQPNGELRPTVLPGDSMCLALDAFYDAVKAVIRDFEEHDVWRRLLDADPRLDTQKLAIDVRIAKGLLGSHMSG